MAEQTHYYEPEPFTPDFDLKIVRIEHLSTSPEGFSLETLRSEPRETGEKPIEWLFDHEQDVKVSHPPHKLDVKLGTRSVLRDLANPNLLRLVITPAFYYEYKNPLTARNPELPMPCGTAASLFTTEPNGSHNLMVEERGDDNFFYGGGIPGASVAGMWNAPWQVAENNKVKLLNIDTDTAKTNVFREMNEETGLLLSDLDSLAIAGYAFDKVKPHPEWLFKGVTHLSAEQVKQRVREAVEKGKIPGSHNFAETVYVIPGTVDAIDTLLTKVKSPLPPTHVAAYAATWYSLLMEQVISGQLSLEEADRLKNNFNKRVDDNYHEIDDMVAFYYRKNPDELTNLFREGQPRNPHGYTPAYYPLHQGLPTAKSQFKEHDLLIAA